ncbi:MAG: chitobiase/beta-hexosaminidase C-terminal domain-containing protein, partial [Spirochaetales bacterium]|nr:chitobiase/beta-hexosaminidase C-terminal domain-containing protein [Spirochaetales bacterium]
KIDDGAWQTYTAPIEIVGSSTADITKTISAKVTGVIGKTNESSTVTQTYTVSYPQLAGVVFNPADGTCDTDSLITLTASVAGADIYYTTNGSAPQAIAANKYNAPFKLTVGTKTVKAFAVKAKYKNSAVKEATYIVTEAEQTGGINLTLAKKLMHTNGVWEIENTSDSNFAVGRVIFGPAAFETSTEYTLSYPAGLQAAVSIIQGTVNNVIDSTTTSGAVTFTTNTSTDNYYFVFEVTEAMNNVQLSIYPTGNAPTPVTAVAITPNSAADLAMTVGDVKTFNVTYTPNDATVGKEVAWSVSDPTVLSLAGSTVTALKAGTSYLIVTSTSNNTITKKELITVSSQSVVSDALGMKHPASGTYSPVSESTWGNTAYTLGANVSGGNTTFALYSANATKVLLEIYNQPYGQEAAYDYWMTKNTTSNQWQATLQGDLTGKMYAFRVWGPNWTYSDSWKRGGSSAGCVNNTDYDANGNRFNPNKVVFDPYAREITHDPSNAVAIAAYNTSTPAYQLAEPEYAILSTGQPVGSTRKWREYDSGTIAPKGYIISDSTDYGTKPQIAAKDAIIYEAHARGLTKHPSVSSLSDILSGMDGFSGVENIPEEYRGTYKGAAMMVSYLKALGINTIELLPVHESDNDGNKDNKASGNYWAYMTFDYFAPDRRYSSDKSAGGPTKEFKEMVKAFHDEGMEVYLDVVYNHSGEGGTWNGNTTKWENGVEITNTSYDEGKQCTIVSMRGIDNQTYYSLVPGTKWAYWENTGCGNNLQCDNPYVRQFILDSLTYWIEDMGVDGFRFDLAPVLGRVNSGSGWNFSSTAKTLTDIASLGSSNNVEMIAEAWDCETYQVGQFPSGWGEWNGRFRDSIRNFIGNGGRTSDKGDVLSYINGDYDNFYDQGGPQRSINFVVAHDGYTLADLCSGYSPAGEAYNKDASKLQWPFGPSDGGDGSVPGSAFGSEPANKRQANRNYTAIQMISRGVPMIVWGDEFCRTQNGNNNPYNVDSVATWNNYNMINTSSPHLVATGSDNGTMAYHNNFGTFGNTANVNGNFKFMQYMLNLRKNEPALRQDTYNVRYDFKKEDGVSDLSDGDRCVWIKINGSSVSGGHDYLVFVNMYIEQEPFTIPSATPGYHWIRVADTQAYFETEFNSWSDATAATIAQASYGVAPWSVVILKQVSDAPETPTCAAPTIGGTTPFDSSTSVSISCSTTGASIYYTIDGSTPTTSSTSYSSPISINKTTTVKAIAVKSGYNNSTVASKTFTKNQPTCATPTISGTTPFETSTSV